MSRRRDSILSILGYAAAVIGVAAAICGLTLCHKPSRVKTVRVEVSSPEAAVSSATVADTLDTDTISATASRKKKPKASPRKRVERSFLDEPVPSPD